MTKTVPLDLGTARALVRLRYALEHADALARDTSEPGAHTAIVALDGAVEHALWLVARVYGVPVKAMANRQELVNKVRAALTDARRPWQPAGGASADQLHRARNQAQHAALLFDVAQLPDWTTAARAFIDSLLEAAFERRISDVALADAVRDEHLGDVLRRAEHEIQQPGPSAFLLVCEAFDEARRRWREQQGHVYSGWLTLGLASEAKQPALGMLNSYISQDERLTDFLEVVPFAPDVGEYSWFLSERRQQFTAGWIPGPDENRRALVFVSGWIVRWEVFDRGYPLESWQEHLESLAPPIVGDGKSTTVVEVDANVTREVPGTPSVRHLVFHLANVPDRGRGPWGTFLHQALVTAANELNVDVRFDGVQLSLTGHLLLVCRLGYSADDVSKVVKHAIRLADGRYHDWNASATRRQAELDEIKAAFATLVFSARRREDELFASVEVHERPTDAQPVVSLGFNLGEWSHEELDLIFQGFQGAGGVFASAGVIRDRVEFEAFELTPDNQNFAREVVRRCEEVVLERRAHHAQRKDEFARFRDRLTELF